MSGNEFTLLYSGIPDLLPMQDRSPGTHVSDIIHSLCLRLGHYVDDGSLPDMTRLQMGNAWERAVASMYEESDPNRWAKGWEVCLDGVYGTPDFIDLHPNERGAWEYSAETSICQEDANADFSVEECKCTWMSARNDIHSEKFWKYKVQLMAYCKMLGACLGHLHVLFVNGEYEKGVLGTPVYRVWRAEFTQGQLDQNWNMLMKHAETM